MFNEGNQIHNFISSSSSGTVIPVPVPQHWLCGKCANFDDAPPKKCLPKCVKCKNFDDPLSKFSP